MGKKRKSFQSQNISRGSQPSVETTSLPESREWSLGKAYGHNRPTSLGMAAMGAYTERDRDGDRGVPWNPRRATSPFPDWGCVQQTGALHLKQWESGPWPVLCPLHYVHVRTHTHAHAQPPPRCSRCLWSENPRTYPADKTLLSQETSNMLSPHFHAGLPEAEAAVPPAGLLPPWVLRLQGSCSGLPLHRRPMLP